MLFALHLVLPWLALTLCGVFPCPDCRLEAQYGHQQDVDMIPLVRDAPIYFCALVSAPAWSSSLCSLRLPLLTAQHTVFQTDDGEGLQGHRLTGPHHGHARLLQLPSGGS
jgi:hypothetical protein